MPAGHRAQINPNPGKPSWPSPRSNRCASAGAHQPARARPEFAELDGEDLFSGWPNTAQPGRTTPRNRTPGGGVGPRPLARNRRSRAPAVPPVPRGVAGIASARAHRAWMPRCGATRLRPGAGLRRRRARHPGPAGGGPRRPPRRSGAEGFGRPAPALQALDYWIRVKWHLDRGEFASADISPGSSFRRPAAPVAGVSLARIPSFHRDHPEFFSPAIEVERVGIGVEWRKGLQVMFRLAGSERPR